MPPGGDWNTSASPLPDSFPFSPAVGWMHPVWLPADPATAGAPLAGASQTGDWLRGISEGKLLLLEAPQMRYLVDDRSANLFDHLRFGAAGRLDRAAEDGDAVGQNGSPDANARSRNALVEAKQDPAGLDACRFPLFRGRLVGDEDRDVIKIVPEPAREATQGSPDEPFESPPVMLIDPLSVVRSR